MIKRPNHKQWTDVQMVAAMNAVKNREMGVNEALPGSMVYQQQR